MTTSSALEPMVEPQGAYLSYRCPEAVQLDVLSPVEPLPPSDFYSKLGEEGSTYEDEVYELLRSEVPGAEYVPPHIDADLREELTLECLRAGVPLILGGRLPTDREGHRVGEPDVLVRALEDPGPEGRWEYRAVDVKGHLVRKKTGDDADDLPTKLMRDPCGPGDGPGDGGTDAAEVESSLRFNSLDAFQLAHYQRMLESCGHAAAGGRWGGIIGKELRIGWYDLDAPSGDAVELGDGEVGRLSLIQIYDIQFASRLVVMDRALAHKADPNVALLAEPILISDCAKCCWRDYCAVRLEEAADLSLIRGINQRRRRIHHELGVTDLHDLARLDYLTAKVMSEVDLPVIRSNAAGTDPSTPIAEVIPRRRSQIGKLARHGIHTVSDLSRLQPGTLRYEGLGMNDLADQIDLARARTAAGSVYRKRQIDSLEVPRGDVEIDVDMECTNDGVYLWGALIAQRWNGELSPCSMSPARYIPFASWDQPIEVAQVGVFREFWDWLCAQRAECAASGRTLRAYCYTGAENYRMKEIAPALGIENEVKEFLESEQWVDLHQVISDQLVTGHSMGLKDVAPLAGFSWRCDDSGGTQAIVRYDEAAAAYDGELREEARNWLLEYNEDDVRATAALREWLDGEARSLPSVGDLSF